ncbi:S66 family peptidase [Evansella tamaricis]|uniref:LD-carboxypeptidase n=1 Tax=Evansella tamaricis TaxID=2069301 RepID=A0ABS6JML9_9BACI|nr:S66 peptidase family protein [Evansella tamaricis]MBU9713675.1 LD-carboxypeptidase [Evansella tamaricis]
MKYPAALQMGDVIGITATSTGVTGVFEKKLDNAIRQMRELGFPTMETESVRQEKKLVSSHAEQRTKEFMELWKRRDVNTIIPPWGGIFLMEILEHLSTVLDAEKNPTPTLPKWVVGFSDTSTLLFYLTVTHDFASVHGPNMLDFGNDPIDPSVKKLLDVLKLSSGEAFSQTSFDFYQKHWLEVTDTSFPPFHKTEKVEWKSLRGKGPIQFQGRLIGGCLDTISTLIGTPYAPVQSFIERYKGDGFIWYFESCGMNAEEIYRALWQMKHCGWFEHCNGFLYGRPEGYRDEEDFELTDALEKTFASANIPVIYDVDIGHLPPQMVLVNGAMADVTYEDGKGKIVQRLI